METKGYPIEIFKDKSNLEKFKCSICLEIIRECISCNCFENHSFCKYCITNQLQFKNKCPVGNQALNKSELKNNKILEELIEEKICICLQTQHGCNWEGNPNAWLKHETECKFKMVSCNFCFKLIKKLEKDAHELSCVENTKTKAKITVNFQESGEEQKLCEFSQFGCKQMVKRKEYSSHVCSEFHISLLLNEIKALKKENENLKSKFEQMESIVIKETWCEICKTNSWFYCGQCILKKCLSCQTSNVVCCRRRICDDCRRSCRFCLRKCCEKCLKVCSQCNNDICFLCENQCKYADQYPSRKDYLPMVYRFREKSNLFIAQQIINNKWAQFNLENYNFENEEIRSQITVKPIIPNKCSVCVVYDRFFISGGTVDNVAVNDFWEICPRESTVKKLPNVPNEKFNHKTQWIPQNQIIAFGGRKLGGGFCEATQLYNLISNDWEILPNLNTPRTNCTVGIWNDHIILALGGFSDMQFGSFNAIEMFDINQKEKGWVCLEIKEMNDWNFCQNQCSVQINSQELIVFGGKMANKVHSFNMANIAFSKKCDYEKQDSFFQETPFFYKNAIYIIGGNSQQLFIYDVESNTVSYKEPSAD